MKRNFKRWFIFGTMLALGLLIGGALLYAASIMSLSTGVVPDERLAEPHDSRLVASSSPVEIEPTPYQTDTDQAKGNEVDPDQTPENTGDPGGIAWRLLRWQDENGQIPSDGLLRAREQLATLQRKPLGKKSDPLRPDDLGAWYWLGPGNIGGRIRSILIHPTNPNRMWVGSVSGGIWTTADAGANWQPVNDFLASLAVSTLVMDPTNANTLYAGTGEGFWDNGSGTGSPSGLVGIQGAGIFKSVDGGVTWAQLLSTSNANFQFATRLAFSPNGQTLLAATSTGIWRSTDGGNTWSQRTFSSVLDIAFHPANNARAIASGRGFALVSSDGGQTWTRATGLPPSAGRIEVAYAPNNPITIYASVDITQGQVWRSTNDGQTFVQRNTTNLGYLGGQGGYDNAIWVDPTNSNTVIVGGIDLWRSTDGGSTFAQISDGGQQQSNHNSAHADQHFIVSHPQFNGTSNRVVYFSNDGGLYVANDVSTVAPTSGWQDLNHNLGITQFYGAAGNVSTGVIVGGTQDNGTLLYKPVNGAQGWTTTYDGDGGFTAADQTNSNYFYGEYPGLKIFRSSDGGNGSDFIEGQYWTGSAWVWKSAPYVIADVPASNANFIAPFIIDPNNAQRLLAGGISLWRTNDARTANTATTGPSWVAIKSPTTGNSSISAIAIAQGNSDVVWVGHNNGDVYATTNGTAASPAWAHVDTNGGGLPNRYITSLAIDPHDSNRVYVTLGGFSTNNVWRTDDGGSTWTAAAGSGTTALVQAPVNSLLVQPDYSEWIYAGTEVGIFFSEDKGQSWTSVNQAPSNVAVDQLFWMDLKLTAATYGRGIYQTAYPLHPMFIGPGGLDILGCGFYPAFPCQTIPYGLGLADTGGTLAIASGSYSVISGYVLNKRSLLRSAGGVVNIVATP